MVIVKSQLTENYSMVVYSGCQDFYLLFGEN